MNFFVGATAFLSIITALIFIPMIFMSNGAPQEAAAAAMGVFIIFIPYSIARTKQSEAALKNQDKIIHLLEKLNNTVEAEVK